MIKNGFVMSFKGEWFNVSEVHKFFVNATIEQGIMRYCVAILISDLDETYDAIEISEYFDSRKMAEIQLHNLMVLAWD